MVAEPDAELVLLRVTKEVLMDGGRKVVVDLMVHAHERVEVGAE